MTSETYDVRGVYKQRALTLTLFLREGSAVT